MWNLGLLGASVGGAAAGDYDLLETTILGSNQSTVSFTSLNSTYGSTYKHLQLRATIKVTRSGSGEGTLGMKINGATSNYRSHRLRGDGTSVVSNNYSLAYAFVGTPARADTSNVFAPLIIDLLDPFDTSKNTTLRTLSGINDSDNTIALYSGLYVSTSAVDSLEFIEPVVSGDFITGSRFSLYGIKAA